MSMRLATNGCRHPCYSFLQFQTFSHADLNLVLRVIFFYIFKNEYRHLCAIVQSPSLGVEVKGSLLNIYFVWYYRQFYAENKRKKLRPKM